MKYEYSQSNIEENKLKQLELLVSEKYCKLTMDIEKSKQELQQLENLKKYCTQLSKNTEFDRQSNVEKQKKPENSLLDSLSSPVKKSHLIVFASVMLLIGTIFPVYSSFLISEDSNSDTVKSRYVIENLRGDTIDTWKSWRLASGVAMTIAIANPNSFDQNTLNVVKNAVSSEKFLEINDGITHKGPKDSSSNFYLGWQGALSSLDDVDTLYEIPQKFNFINSRNGEGDVIITLTNLQHDDGLSGHTKSIVSNNEILKSFITIYDVDNLSEEELSTIVRHEFGHVIGIGHSSDPEDLMYDTISGDFPYISDCHLNAIITLYDGHQAQNVECEK